MAEVASAFVSILPSTKGFGSTMNRQIGPQLNSSAKTSGSRFGKVFAMSSMSPLKAIGAAAVGLFAIQKVKQFFGSALDEAREAQKVSALTAQVIKSTGGAAQVSAKQVGALSNAISLKTGIDDEAVQSGANLLLTFKNIRNEAGAGNKVFSQATSLVQDMSVALGTAARGSAIQLGKALNDPIKGVTALGRAGVQFTAQQTKQIKTFVASGKILRAQKIILGEVKSQVGGAAAAAATAGEKFKVAFANLAESVGTALLPQLDRLLGVGTKVITFLMNRVPAAFDAIKAAVAPVTAVIGDFVTAHLQPLLTILSGAGGAAVAAFASLLGGTLVSALGVLLGALVSPVAIIGALAGAAVYAYTHFTGFRTAVDGLVASLKTNFLPVLQQAGTTVTTVILPAISSLATYLATNLLPVFKQVAGVITGTVLPILASLAAFVYGQLYPAIFKIVVAIGQKLKPVFDQLVVTFQAQVLPALQRLLAKFHEYQPAIQQLVLLLAKISGKMAVFAATILGKVLPVVIRFQGVMAGQFISSIAAGIGILGQIITKILQFAGTFKAATAAEVAFVKGLIANITKAINTVKAIPGQAKAALGSLGGLLVSAGASLIQGLIDGVTSKLSDLRSKLSEVTNLIPKWKGPADRDAVLLRPAGQLIMKGLSDGIEDGKAPLQKKLSEVTKQILDHLQSQRDAIKSQLNGLKSDFQSLAGSISSAFTGDLFQAPTAGDFISNLTSTKGSLTSLKRAFHKLLKEGVAPSFLSDLYASGNSPLILDLAAGPKRQALDAASLYGQVGDLSSQLGNQVARADIGPKIDATNKRLEKIEQAIKDQPRHFARELNHSAAGGRRRAS